MNITKIQHIVQDYKRGIIDFDSVAMEIYLFQYKHNPVYRQFCDLIHRTPAVVRSYDNIPFLPIEFFKSHTIKTGNWNAECIYESSGTTSETTSRHHIYQLSSYLENAVKSFEQRFGGLEGSIILGLLPSYLERQNASLVAMVDHFIKRSNRQESGFYLDDHAALFEVIEQNQEAAHIVLFGVSYALLDYVEHYQHDHLQNFHLIETGGMKGRREEITKDAMYVQLKSGFPLNQIDSEYGMTELLSQAYTIEETWFSCPETMQVHMTQINDPFQKTNMGKTGLINVIDLMNFHSCSFISTQDLGKQREDNSFQVLGRLDHSDIRGCNLLVQ